MSKYFLFLQTVHDTVNDLAFLSSKKRMIKSNFSEPKTFTGGVDIYNWKSLSVKQKKEALAKDWYIYYSFRDPETKKLKRMPNIKGGANRLKTMRERLNYLKTMSDALLYILEQGLNPYQDNDLTAITSTQKPIATTTIDKEKEVIKGITIEVATNIKDAFDFALRMKKGVLSQNSYKNFELRIRKYRKTLNEEEDIESISKKDINTFLNDVLVKTSTRTRNNTRVDLSGLFQVLEDNEMIPLNFIKSIPLLKTTPERNKTYTPDI